MCLATTSTPAASAPGAIRCRQRGFQALSSLLSFRRASFRTLRGILNVIVVVLEGAISNTTREPPRSSSKTRPRTRAALFSRRCLLGFWVRFCVLTESPRFPFSPSRSHRRLPNPTNRLGKISIPVTGRATTLHRNRHSQHSGSNAPPTPHSVLDLGARSLALAPTLHKKYFPSTNGYSYESSRSWPLGVSLVPLRRQIRGKAVKDPIVSTNVVVLVVRFGWPPRSGKQRDTGVHKERKSMGLCGNKTSTA